MMIAEFVNPLSLHKLHGKVGDALCRCSAVKKLGNVWMIQAGKSSALEIEPSNDLR